MDQSKILIIGAHGQLGTAMCQRYPQAQAVGSKELDITSRQSLLNYDWTGIELVINAAAFTNVDGAETTEGRIATWDVNASGSANLAFIAIKHDLTLVHFSTDYVFDGSINNHNEREAFSPLSAYGSSKAAGDLAVSLVPKHYNLRTTWLIGEGKNFVSIMRGLGERGIAPSVVSDQVGRLTFTTELVAITDHLLTTHAEFGTYNATNSGQPASWAQIARRVFELSGYDIPVTDVTTAEYYAGKDGIAPRPLGSIMDLQKLIDTGYTPADWRQSLSNYIKEEQA